MLERHIQTVLAAMMIGLIAWVGVSVTSSRETIAALKVTTTALEKTVYDMKTEIRQAVYNNYTDTDATRDKADIKRQIHEVTSRVQHLENNMSEVLKDHAKFHNGSTNGHN